jgi:hypothetical protein
VAVCTILCLAIALLYALSKEPIYFAEATLSLRSEEGIAPTGNANEVLSRLRDSTVTDRLPEEAARRAGWQSSQKRLQRAAPLGADQQRGGEGRLLGQNAGGGCPGSKRLLERLGRARRGVRGAAGGWDRRPWTPKWRRQPNCPRAAPDRRVFLAVAAAGCGGLLVGGIGALFLEGTRSPVERFQRR